MHRAAAFSAVFRKKMQRSDIPKYQTECALHVGVLHRPHVGTAIVENWQIKSTWAVGPAKDVTTRPDKTRRELAFSPLLFVVNSDWSNSKIFPKVLLQNYILGVLSKKNSKKHINP